MGVSYTEEQRACIDSLIGPVDVSAGAGSGKTFTLTQRIAKALADPASGVDDIDQICAITFTEKAAAELKGRVRSTLRAQGMFDQALKVDAAWISTIHGMCSRILRAHALDLGIDPAFSILGESDAARLFDESLDEALQADRQGPRRFDALTRTINVRTNGFGDSISKMVKQVLDASLGQKEGPRALVRSQGECPGSGALARRLLMAYEELSQVLAAQKEGAQRNKALEVTEQAIQALEDFLSRGETSQEAFLRTLDLCKFVPKAVPKGAKPALEEYLDIHCEVIRQFVMGLSGRLADQLIDLACDVDQLLTEKKRTLGALDNNDLLVQAMRAMEVPSVVADYCQRFRLVMVDEFQDTDQIQLSIVRTLAGPGMRYLCTVGDAQQSIYGFRGADIQVYRSYQGSLKDSQLKQQGAQPKQLLLSKNFRSHQDVLAFVRHVCQQPRVFGENFLDLEPTYDGGKYKAEHPRIQVRVSATQEKGDYSTIACARALQANQIADYFKQMRDAGHALSEMVLLLGSTSQAGLYAQAIRNQVGPCVIAGGSLFASSQEAQLVGSLLRAIANPQDTRTLFQVLSSQMFALGAGDFLRLTSAWDAQLGEEAPCGLDVGLEGAIRGLQGGLTEETAHAANVFAKAWQSLGKVSVAKIVMQAVQDSGWLLRLEGEGAEGLSKAGNVLKAVRLIERLERDACMGPASLAMRYGAELEVLRESPGALNVGGQEAVRIMTIHASKGLEFPIVALTDFDRAFTEPSLVTRKVDGIPYMSLRVSLGKIAGQDQVKTAFEAYDPDGLTGPLENLPADALHARLVQEAQLAEREERQRLFYVGATRAKEALCVFLALKDSSRPGLGAEESIAGDIRYALFGGEGFPRESCEVDYGGTQPLGYAIAFAGPQGEEAGESGQEYDQAQPFAVPQVRPFEWDDAKLAPKTQTGLFSYSSFSRVLHEVEEMQSEQQPVGFDFDEESLVEKQSLADKDKATDFGSALHRLCQIAALQGFDAARSRIDALCGTYGVRDRDRLSRALENWLSSEECTRAYSFERVQPELPFNISVGSLVMEGEIDLICTNPEDKSQALIIDYKTGGHPDETQEQLQEKHGLQARCYAYAVLMQGYESVQLTFYRVEQGNSVSFAFTQADLPQLLEGLLPACDLLG